MIMIVYVGHSVSISCSWLTKCVLYVTSLLAGILSKIYNSLRMPIVLGTFTSGSPAKFVNVSYYVQSCLDGMKALRPLAMISF